MNPHYQAILEENAPPPVKEVEMELRRIRLQKKQAKWREDYHKYHKAQASLREKFKLETGEYPGLNNIQAWCDWLEQQPHRKGRG